jgi:Rad3-related DNA helicase
MFRCWRKRLGLPVKMALLKGRANYLCRHRLELATQQRSLLGASADRPDARARVAMGGDHEVGDLAELTDLPEQSPVVADDHLDARELSRTGMPAILALPRVRGAPRGAGGARSSW